MITITTQEQFRRTIQALTETCTVIEKMESPKSLTRDPELVAFLRQHAVNLSAAINSFQA